MCSMSKTWFITGTDTDVGKTVATCAFLQAAARAGLSVAGYKPVASGSTMTAEGVRNSDGLMLQANSSLVLNPLSELSGPQELSSLRTLSSLQEPSRFQKTNNFQKTNSFRKLKYDEVNPCAFLEPTSPHIASQLENSSVNLSVLSQGLRHLEPLVDWVVVEGAGGWFTPLTAESTFADWVVAEKLPVILVVGMRLGCINHAVLTAQAIMQSGLTLAGWIANNVQEKGRHHRAYLDTLQRMLPAPLLGEIPHLETENIVHSGQYLDLTVLLR